MALKVMEWLDSLSQDVKGIACWFCKEHQATVAFWENNPSGYDISHGMRPRPSCAHCCNVKGLEYAKAMIAYQRSGDIGGIRTGRVAIPFPPDWAAVEKE